MKLVVILSNNMMMRSAMVVGHGYWTLGRL
jgi:hypothetical protein